MGNTFIFPEGMLATVSEGYCAAMSKMKGVGLNLAALPCEMMYQLQAGVITELRAWEG